MAKKTERAFALGLALIFFITAFGFSGYVIWQLVSQKNASSNSSNATATTNQNSTTNSSNASQAAQNCTGAPSEAPIAAPATYKPTGTVSTLEETDLQVGNGATAQNGDCLIVKYYGSLASNGTVFDQNFTKNTGFEFVLGAGQVIPGWDKGLVGMKVGGERRLVIPPSLAYGNHAQGTIPANSTLVFVVKLINIVHP